MITGHGNNIYQCEKQQIKADFSSNIAFNNHSSQILSFLSGRMESLCNYPDPLAEKLTKMIAAHCCVDHNKVLVTNGSAEAFYMIAHYLSNAVDSKCRTAILTPSFAEYEDSCTLYKHEITYLNLADFHSLQTLNFDSLWLASPNNPDGRRLPIADIYSLAKKNRDCKIILDRAYNSLSSEEERSGEIPENVILVESFTKLYGIPGLRLGYVVADPKIIASLSTMRPPWSVNALSLLGGEYILSNLDDLQIDVEELIGESRYLQDAVASIEGFRLCRSNCNYFLVEITDGRSAADLYDYLLEEHGILIRNCSNFRGLEATYFRVAAQSRENNNKLIAALKQWR